MGNLKNIKDRHGRDTIRDAVFIVAAVLLTALSIGSVTSKAAGKPHERQWQLSVVESTPEIAR